MLKLTGAIMIILSGTALGYLKSRELKTRRDSLKKILYSLHIMENEISYGKNSMDHIMDKIERLGGLEFDRNGMENAGDRFLNAVRNRELQLTGADMEILDGFSQSLGTTDSYVQLRNIKNAINSLESLAEVAEENFNKYGKMYRSIGVLLGVLAVIVLV